jgi:long-chain fatty acid transport protein
VKSWCVALFVAILCAASAAAFASGWDNGLINARAAGMAAAFAGLADDASAVFYNPAGLSFIDRRGEVLICGKLYYPTHTYTGPDGGSVTSEYDAQLVEGFACYRFNDRITAGVGVYTPYAGGGIEWSERDIGFYLKGTLGVLAFSPAVAVRVNDRVAIGAAVNGYYFIGNQEMRNPLALPPAVSIEEHDFVVTATGGVYVKPVDRLSLGVTVRGPSAVTMTGTTEAGGIEFDSETTFDLPIAVAFGAAFRVTEALTVSAEIDYYDWSRLERLKKVTAYPPPVGTTAYYEELGYKDAILVKLGAEHRFGEAFAVQIGAHYDEGAVPQDRLSLTNIDVPKVTLFGGVSYTFRRFSFCLSGFDTLGEPREATAPGGLSFPGSYDLDSLGLLFGVGYGF